MCGGCLVQALAGGVTNNPMWVDPLTTLLMVDTISGPTPPPLPPVPHRLSFVNFHLMQYSRSGMYTKYCMKARLKSQRSSLTQASEKSQSERDRSSRRIVGERQ